MRASFPRVGARRISALAGPIVRVSIFLAAFLQAEAAAAQAASDDIPRERTVPPEELIKAEIENSPYHLGSIYVLPLLSIQNLGYDSNVFGVPNQPGVSEPVSDWRADVSAGARLTQRLGGRMYLRGEALPEYSWYLNLTDRRQFGGVYWAAWTGFFNRFSFEVGGLASQSTEFLSTETLALLRQSFRRASAKLELEVAGPLSVFAGGGIQRHRYFPDSQSPADIQNAEQLDRTEDAGRVGLRFKIRRNLDVTGVVEQTRTRFESAGQQGDNHSTAYLAGIHYDLPRFFINLSGGYRQGHPDNGSTFPSYSTGTGSYFVSFFLTKRVELQAYGRRGTSYSLTVENPYYFDTSNGGGVNIRLGRRVTLRGFGEYGTDDYPVPVLINTGVEILRKDKTTNYGGGVSFSFLRHAVLTALASKTRLESNVPGVSRSVFRFVTSVNFQGDFRR